MPLIEELPVSQTIKASHGWAYVADTGPIHAQQAGTRDRKRAAVPSSRTAATSTAKRDKAVQQRLDSLNKENYRDGVAVPIPTSNRERDRGRKLTSNVKRILGYQRNFAHYLADVEANYPGESHYRVPNAPTAMGPPPPPPTPALAKGESGHRKASTDAQASKKGNAARRSTIRDSGRPTTPTDTPTRGTKRSRQASQSQPVSMADAEPSPASTPVKKEEQTEGSEGQDTTMQDAPSHDAPGQPAGSPPGAPNEFGNNPPYPPQWDADPLLASSASDVPPMPTDRIMQLLISEQPLTFTAARATPLPEEKQPPPRRFCGICGYWGKVKCKKCEEWTCGLMECWRSHEGTCPMANMY